MKVLKICIGVWDNASRDKRELSAVRELGAEVEVIAKSDANHQNSEVSGFHVTRLSARPLGESVPVMINRIISIFTWASYVRNLTDVDVISGHDISGLTIGYLSNIGKNHQAKLVYDSHEFELGRSVQRSRLTSWVICQWERFLMKRCAFSIMVNDSIADEVQRIHRLKERPVVVRNIPSYWELEPAKTQEIRQIFGRETGLPADTFWVLYHGVLANDRGIENMLRAVARLPKIAAVILGNADTESYLNSLHALCDELSIKDRVLFHKAVPIESLKNYVSAVDVGIAAGLATFKSYYLSLPNKFFENIQSLTPLIVSDFPEMSRIVDQYQIGLKVDPANVDELAAAIERMRTDRAFYASCKEHLKQAKEDLCWEKEKIVLQDAYRKIMM